VTETALRQAILDLLAVRGAGKSICPSEAARRVVGEGGDWRALMDAVRAVAATLVAEGVVEVTQKGAVVDIARARGPIRLRATS